MNITDDRLSALHDRALRLAIDLHRGVPKIDGETVVATAEAFLEFLRKGETLWESEPRKASGAMPQSRPWRNNVDPQERLLAAIKEAGEEGISRSAILGDVLRGNVLAVDLDQALAQLAGRGLIRAEQRPTGGRPVELWFAVDPIG